MVTASFDKNRPHYLLAVNVPIICFPLHKRAKVGTLTTKLITPHVLHMPSTMSNQSLQLRATTDNDQFYFYSCTWTAIARPQLP